MEIIQERLEREFNLTLVTTVPNVAYRITEDQRRGTVTIENASKMPSPGEIDVIEEPYIEADILCPTEYLSAVIDLCKKKRGVHVRVDYIDARRCMAVYQMPLAEIVLDFYDKLKTLTRGYGSLEYRLDRLPARRPGQTGHPAERRAGGRAVVASCIATAPSGSGGTLAQKLRKLIPRQQFEVAIQAAIGNQDHRPRDVISPLRKNVTAKCYGGDITRKRKLLEKQV